MNLLIALFAAAIWIELSLGLPFWIAMTLALAATTAAIAVWTQAQRKARLALESQALAQREREDYRNILQEANDSVLLIDTVSGQVLEANARCAQLLGYSLDEFRKLTIFDLHPQSLLQQSSARIADIWEKGGLVYQDLPLTTKAGSEIPVECSARMLTFYNRPTVLIYARDIRERLELEAEIREQNEVIAQKNQDLTDSIVYAQRIQSAILPDLSEIAAALPESFVFYRAKDIVSGDFYWFQRYQHQGRDLALIAAADCTGHGVPGAFMSMVGSTLLNEMVTLQHRWKPNEILDALHPALMHALRQDVEGSTSLDGMDVALCTIDYTNRKLWYAGAMRPLMLSRQNDAGEWELTEIRGTRRPIGGKPDPNAKPFELHEFELKSGEGFYIFSDGYPDQFGGPDRKKYMTGRFRKFLHSLRPLKMQDQSRRLEEEYDQWRGAMEQVDDVMVIGVRFR
jgi:PAS domain S-box-containing protein